MEQAEIMANLMRSSRTKIVIGNQSTGHRLALHHTPVQGERVRARRSVRGEIAETQELRIQVRQEVHVEIGIRALAQRTLHAKVILANSPVAVDSLGGVDEVEGDVHASVVVVHLGELGAQLGVDVGVVACVGERDVVEEGVDLECLVGTLEAEAFASACVHDFAIEFNKAGWRFGSGTSFLDGSRVEQ